MALAVYFERRDPDSFWAPYLATLQDPDCPAFADALELAELQGHYVRLRVEWEGRCCYYLD